ncbi:MAG TPA: DUF4350 domain-containing protein [Candidatus Dormibacteraeota bacterium]|nr:DUF4350 domain-containing protein [Candidatus Dormibacteraeota bacterium]
MNRRRWIGFGVVILLIAIVVLLRGNAAADSPEHSSASDGSNGTSGLRLYAQALGHGTGTVEGDFNLPSTPALLFVFTPIDTQGFTISEAQQLSSWIAAGNVVVYAAENGDGDVDRQFKLRRSSGTVNASVHAAAPIFGGVTTLSGSNEALALQPTAAQVPLLRNPSGDVLGVQMTVGSGQLIALADPHVLCNGYLQLADNGRFAADLIAMTPSGGSVLFDEYHHGVVTGGTTPEIAWMSTPWGAALVLAVLVIVIGLGLRGRAFGPHIPLRAEVDRSSAEYAAAVGSLLHRTGARTVTLETLLAATQRSVAERVGLSSDTPESQLHDALAQRAPAEARELASVQTSVSQGVFSETDVLALARRLHQLAYPLAAVANQKGDKQ